VNLTLVVKKKTVKRSRSIKSNQIGNISKTYKSVIKAIGDETRFQILLLLKKGPKTVPQISAELKRSRYDFYYHLDFLESKGIVKSKATGRSARSKNKGKNKRKTYSLTPQGQEQLRTFSQLIGTGKV
jgi:DNA-binding PadR family transcriptional regulator